MQGWMALASRVEKRAGCAPFDVAQLASMDKMAARRYDGAVAGPVQVFLCIPSRVAFFCNVHLVFSNAEAR
jgi:hypothetical protein